MNASTDRPRRRLIDGRLMRCPRCKKQHDILRYVPMRQIEEFLSETTPIYKCPECRWLFAPVDGLLEQVLLGRVTTGGDAT